MDNNTEIWKSLATTKDSIEISNYGNIRDTIKNTIIYPNITEHGYYYIWFNINNKSVTFRLARLVYKLFKGKLINGMVIDHKDNDRSNNYVDNLQQITARENSSKDRWRKGKTSRYTGVSWDVKSNKWSACICFNGKTFHIGKFDIELEASMAYEDILTNGKSNKYKYNYINNTSNNIKAQVKHMRAIVQYDLNGNIIAEYDSIANTSRILNIATSSIHNSLKKDRIVKDKWSFKYKPRSADPERKR